MKMKLVTALLSFFYLNIFSISALGANFTCICKSKDPEIAAVYSEIKFSVSESAACTRTHSLFTAPSDNPIPCLTYENADKSTPPNTNRCGAYFKYQNFIDVDCHF